MSIFGSQRDISFFRHINRELLWDVVTQQCAVYKLKLDQTKVNIYGEASGDKFYFDPVLINALIQRGEKTQSSGDMGVDMSREMEFRFFRDDLVDAKLVPEVGDIILYQESYFEVDNVNDNQLFVGKDPAYPYNDNPLNPELEEFGTNLSIIVKAHITPADRVQITRER
jgi:signal peptidase I